MSRIVAVRGLPPQAKPIRNEPLSVLETVQGLRQRLRARNETVSITESINRELITGGTFEINVPFVPRAEWDQSVSNVRPDKEVWATIQAQIDAVPDGTAGNPNVIRFPVGFSTGLYYTKRETGSTSLFGCTELTNRHNLVIEGPSLADMAAVYTSDPAWDYPGDINQNQFSNRKQFLVRNCTNITFRYLRVFGSNYVFSPNLSNGNPWFWGGGPDGGGEPTTRAYYAPWEFEHGIDVRNSTGIHIHDCQFDDLWGDGLYFQDNPGAVNVTVQDVRIDGIGRQGVAIGGGSNMLFDRIDIGQTVKARRAGFDLEPISTWPIDGVEVRNFTINSHLRPFAARGTGGKMDNVHIHHGTVDGTSVPWIDAGHTDNVNNRKTWSVHDVTHVGSLGSPLYAMIFRNMQDISVNNNTMPVSAAQSRGCVSYEDCTGTLDVTNNDFGDGCFIRFQNSPVGTVSGNICAGDCGDPTCDLVLVDPVIAGVTWDCAGLITDAVGSDLWPTTWSDDDKQYTMWGDGDGFEGTSRFGWGIASLTGDPTSYVASDVGEFESGGGGRKVSSCISLGGVLYMWSLNQTSGNRELIKSTNKGVSHSSPLVTFNEAIDPIAFVQFGKDNADAVDSYVYNVWGNGNGLVYLCRVLAAQIETKASYEWFSGTPGSPAWSSTVGNAAPIFSGTSSRSGKFSVVTYFPPIDRYIMTFETAASVGDWAIYESAAITGPYSLIASYTDWCGWGGEGTGVDGQLPKYIAPKWIGSVGGGTLEFWMVFSAGSTGGGTNWDRFNLIKGTFQL